ncbi:hypothetical protein HDU92_003194 [Lobulomyces angularis]|nr:hypothetical protein HDU92_003194 [Lobulomyces angularis]
MTLAARLATLSNIGLLDPNTEVANLNIIQNKYFWFTNDQWDIFFGNFAVTQIQSIVVGIFAGSWGWILGGCRGGIPNLAIIVSSAIICFAMSSMILSIIMSWLVLSCRKHRVDPDNIAIPFAASFGDFAIIFMLAFCGKMFETFEEIDHYISYVTIVMSLIFLNIWMRKVKKNKFVKKVLKEGWISMIFSILLSSLAGVILEKSILEFETIALLVPVLNGLTGNISSIYASRFSTSLHKKKNMLLKIENKKKSSIALYSAEDNTEGEGEMEERALISKSVEIKFDDKNEEVTIGTFRVEIQEKSSENITESFKFKNRHAFSSLLILSVMISTIFLISIKIFNLANIKMDMLFFFIYSFVNLFLTIILLYMAHHFTSFVWSKGLDPDNISLPYITAVADVIGNGMKHWMSLLEYITDPWKFVLRNLNRKRVLLTKKNPKPVKKVAGKRKTQKKKGISKRGEKQHYLYNPEKKEEEVKKNDFSFLNDKKVDGSLNETLKKELLLASIAKQKLKIKENKENFFNVKNYRWRPKMNKSKLTQPRKHQ